jgi:cytochrome P450
MDATTKNDPGIVPPLFSPDFQRDPYPTYRHCLSGAPLQPLEGRPGTWLLFRYELCATVIRDARLSSMRPAASLVAVGADALTEFDDLVRHMQRWLLLRDAPRHSELRTLMNRGFAPAVIERLRHRVVGIIDGLLDNMQNEGTVDLMKDFAYPLPVRVICELLGVPEELHARCVALSNDIAVWFANVSRSAESARVAQRAIRELEQYFSAIIRERRSKRKDDLLSLLMDASEGAGGLSEEDLHAQCVMLLFAGHETTRNLIGNGIYTLLKHPDTLRDLREEDSLWPAALEELLRYESPAQAIARGVKSDIEIGGTHLPAGSAIGFMIGAAHRDPRQFPDPDRLNVRRPHLRHLAFGGDAHVCLGITLARLEGHLALTALARRFPNLHLMDETPDWGSTFGLRGLKTLRVQI